ncbi:MFS transporter [Nonomuraea basaltis]|uniref:MFS transporter n=1 Tax=Nonomuraea basaltis TaxID=2495887 RepID=UPI00110C4F35|nr:MFS transporter [Nonomuraea basaltis]TMR94472.1 MFS transporter [Nonomuraea basaltis]
MRKAMAPLLVTILAVFSAQQLLTPVLAPLSRELALTETQLGLVITVAAASLTVASPLWGQAMRRLRLRTVLMLGLGLAAAGLAGFAVVATLGLDGVLPPPVTLTLMLVTRSVVFGVGLAALPVAALTVAGLATTGEADRTRATGLVGAAQGLSLVLGPAGGGALAVVSLLLPLYVAPAICALLAIWVLATVRRGPARPPAGAPRGPRLRPWDARLWPLFAIGFCVFLSLGLVQVVLGFLIADRLHVDPQATAGGVGIALAVTGVVIVGVQGALVPALGWRALRLIRVGTPIAVAAFGLLAVAHSLWLITVAFGLLGVGLGLAMPGIVAAPGLLVGPEEQSSISGLVNAVIGSTFIAGPLLSTALYELAPVAPVLAALAASATALALAWLSPAARHARAEADAIAAP